MQVIDVSRNQLTKIEKLAFKGLYLVEIRLSHNRISVVERGAFENCANITNLDLSYNEISDFERNAFDEITYPTEFHLEFNNLTDLSQVVLIFNSFGRLFILKELFFKDSRCFCTTCLA